MRNLLVIVIMGAVSVVALAMAVSRSSQRQPGVDREPIQDAVVVRTAAVVIGLSPENALIAGCTVGECRALLNWLTSSPSESANLSVALAAESRARSLMSVIEASARAGDSQAQQALAVQRAELRRAAEEVSTAIARLRSAVDAEVGRPITVTLLQVNAVTSRGLPAEFGAVPLSDSEIQRLQLALKAERRAARTGEALDRQHGESLQLVRGRAEVVAARLRLGTDAQAVRAVFDEHGVR